MLSSLHLVVLSALVGTATVSADEEIDGGCSGTDCGTGASCTDVAAPGTGYTCACDAGYTGDSTTDTAASCVGKP